MSITKVPMQLHKSMDEFGEAAVVDERQASDRERLVECVKYGKRYVVRV